MLESSVAREFLLTKNRAISPNLKIHTLTTYVEFINSIFQAPAFLIVGESMLSFEISAIDIVLLVVTLVLLSLYVTKRKETSRSQSQHRVEKERNIKEMQKEKPSNQKAKPPAKQDETSFPCSHHFGFLKQLPRNTAVPDECFGCPKVMQCLFPNE